jgi:NarL family two-component system response regulator LiaR
MRPIRIVLIDDNVDIHEAVLMTLEGVNDIDLVGRAMDGDAGLRLCEKYNPDVVLMDVVMPRMSGIEATRELNARMPHIKTLVLSSYQDIQDIRELLQLGAVGYTLKHSLNEHLADAIRAAYSGNTVMAPEISQKLLDNIMQFGESNSNFTLTARELEVLSHMANGLNNKEIAHTLFISRSTVKFHISNIIEKMEVETRAEAIVLAVRHHLV